MFIFNGLKASVTISGTVATAYPLASSTQTQVNITWNGAATGATLYTVPASKVFHALSCQLGGTATGNAQIKVAGTLVLIGTILANDTVAISTPGNLFTATAGQAITLETDKGGSTSIGGIQGYLVDA